MYSGEINTRISLCISNDEVTDQISALSKSCYSLIRNSLARTVSNTPKTCHITPLLASLHWLKIKERIEYKLISLTYKILTIATYLHNLVCSPLAAPVRRNDCSRSLAFMSA